MKKITSVLSLLLAGALMMLTSCGGGGGGKKSITPEQLAVELDKVYRDVQLLKKSDKQKGWAVYRINGGSFDNDRVAINYRKIPRGTTNVRQYAEDSPYKDLIPLPGKISGISDLLGAGYIYRDLVTGKEFREQDIAENYDTSREIAFSEQEKIDSVQEFLQTEFRMSSAKAQKLSELGYQFKNLSPDALSDRKVLNDFTKEAFGLSYDQVDKINTVEALNEAVQKAASHIGINASQVYLLMAAFAL